MVKKVLIVAATSMEMQLLREALPELREADTLVTGMGPVEAAARLGFHLGSAGATCEAVVNFGVAGAYGGTGLDVLDLAVADSECLADLGYAAGEEVISYDPRKLPVHNEIALDPALLARIEAALAAAAIAYRRGRFATVSCTSTTSSRGEAIRQRWHAICENMEGAALARVCELYGVPFAEIRGISNMVTARDEQQWQLREASRRCAAAVAAIIRRWR